MIYFNGEPTQYRYATVAELVRERQLPERGVAVAVNGNIVPKSQWSTYELQENDRVEVVTAAAGG
jgi:sulfur carrier protein